MVVALVVAALLIAGGLGVAYFFVWSLSDPEPGNPEPTLGVRLSGDHLIVSFGSDCRAPLEITVNEGYDTDRVLQQFNIDPVPTILDLNGLPTTAAISHPLTPTTHWADIAEIGISTTDPNLSVFFRTSLLAGSDRHEDDEFYYIGTNRWLTPSQADVQLGDGWKTFCSG
ncbi:MAG: hypothetical protein LBV30_00875 [Propionibacteriaceae bacterium]|nr:hypothetical protein [Propionibacteriaceae bacterium]